MQTKKLDPDFIDGQTGDAVYKIPRQFGVTQIFVPQGVEVRTREDRHGRNSDYYEQPSRVMPNTFCAEDALVIPFEDMADFILARADPASLAKVLWAKSDEVRYNLEDELGSHYAGDAVTDKERRKFVSKVSGEILDASARQMAAKAAELEDKAVTHYRRWELWSQVQRWWTGVVERVRYKAGEDVAKVITDITSTNPFHGPDPDAAMYDVTGPCWQDARDHWRAKAEQMIHDAGWLDMEDAPKDKTILAQTKWGALVTVAFHELDGVWASDINEMLTFDDLVCWRHLPAPKHFDPPSDMPF